MDDPLRVRRGEPMGDLDADFDGGVLGERPLREPLAQRLAFKQLLDEEIPAGNLFERVNDGNIRVANCGQELGLALEPARSFLVLEEFFRKDLDGDGPPEPGVPRAPNLAHAARAEGGNDLVWSKARASFDAHRNFTSADRSASRGKARPPASSRSGTWRRARLGGS